MGCGTTVEVITLFSTPILEHKFDFNLDYILEVCDEIKEKDPMGVKVSNVIGWQSKHDIQSAFPYEFYCILEKVKIFAKKIGLNSNLKIDCAWININERGGYNQNHDHPNCILSGVLYVKTPKQCGNIEFLNPNRKYIDRDWFGDVVNDCTTTTSSVWKMVPEENVAYIFPSWIDHQVYPNLSDEKRVSISFNISKP